MSNTDMTWVCMQYFTTVRHTVLEFFLWTDAKATLNYLVDVVFSRCAAWLVQWRPIYVTVWFSLPIVCHLLASSEHPWGSPFVLDHKFVCCNTNIFWESCMCILQLHSLFTSMCESCAAVPQAWTTNWGNEERRGIHSSCFLERWKAINKYVHAVHILIYFTSIVIHVWHWQQIPKILPWLPGLTRIYCGKVGWFVLN